MRTKCTVTHFCFKVLTASTCKLDNPALSNSFVGRSQFESLLLNCCIFEYVVNFLETDNNMDSFINILQFLIVFFWVLLMYQLWSMMMINATTHRWHFDPRARSSVTFARDRLRFINHIAVNTISWTAQLSESILIGSMIMRMRIPLELFATPKLGVPTKLNMQPLTIVIALSFIYRYYIIRITIN